VASCIEAELIRDLDLADPIRDIVLERSNEYGEGTGKAATRLFVKLFTVAPNSSVTINLRSGTYDDGVLSNMLNGFGQTQTFDAVHALAIRGIETNPNPGVLEVKAAPANPWTDLLDQFTAASLLRIDARGALVLSTGNRGTSYNAGFAHQSFVIYAPATNAGNVDFDITIVGWKF
jgi:hypothetical protein